MTTLFNGASRVITGVPSRAVNGLTICGWAKYISDSSFSALACLGNSDFSALDVLEKINDTSGSPLGGFIWNGAGYDQFSTGEVVLLGSWFYWAIVWSAGSYYIYISYDGSSVSLKNTSTYYTPIDASFTSISIGGVGPFDTGNTEFRFVRVFTEALSIDGLNLELISRTPKSTNLWASWPLDNASLLDTSGNGRDLSGGTGSVAAGSSSNPLDILMSTTNTIVRLNNQLGTPANIGSNITVPGNDSLLIWDTVAFDPIAIQNFGQLLQTQEIIDLNDSIHLDIFRFEQDGVELLVGPGYALFEELKAFYYAENGNISSTAIRQRNLGGLANLSGSAFSGSIVASGGLTGSLQRLPNGQTYLAAGTNITITTSSNGQIVITSTASGGSGGGADPGAQYLVLATTASLPNERVITVGTGLSGSDAGAGGAFTLSTDYRQVTLIGDAGPFEFRGLGESVYKTVENSVFPTTSSWYLDVGLTQLLQRKTIVRNSQKNPTTINWFLYAPDGSTVIKQFQETITYNGVREVARTRTRVI